MRLNRRGSPVRTARWRSACCAVAVVALVTPLVGCGATDPSASAAGAKAGGSVPAEPTVLRMLNPADPSSIEVFVGQVDQISGGQLVIESVDFYGSDSMGTMEAEQAAFDAVRSGEAPLGMTPVRRWHEQGIRSFDALLAPFLIDRPEVQNAVLDSDVASDMLAGLTGSGLTGLAVLPGRMSYPLGFAHNLIDPTDYQGATMVQPTNPIMAKWLESLGASIMPAPTQDDLESGTIAGTVDQPAEVPAELTTSITKNVTVGPRPLVIYGNADALAALSDQDRTYLEQAARATIDIRATQNQANTAEDIGRLCRVGSPEFLTADSDQVADLHASTGPVNQWLREDPATADFMDRIQQIAADTPVDPDNATALDCPAPNAPPASAAVATPSPLDGTYTVSVTEQDLAASGVPKDWIVPENWGDSVFVFDRGRFANTQHNDQSCTWAYGRFSVDGDTMTWDYDGGGGNAPTGAANKPGEQFGFRWSLYRDVLTLTAAPGAISPVQPDSQWVFNRATTTPDPSALNQQCPPPAAALPH